MSQRFPYTRRFFEGEQTSVMDKSSDRFRNENLSERRPSFSGKRSTKRGLEDLDEQTGSDGEGRKKRKDQEDVTVVRQSYAQAVNKGIISDITQKKVTTIESVKGDDELNSGYRDLRSVEFMSRSIYCIRKPETVTNDYVKVIIDMFGNESIEMVYQVSSRRIEIIMKKKEDAIGLTQCEMSVRGKNVKFNLICPGPISYKIKNVMPWLNAEDITRALAFYGRVIEGSVNYDYIEEFGVKIKTGTIQLLLDKKRNTMVPKFAAIKIGQDYHRWYIAPADIKCFNCGLHGHWMRFCEVDFNREQVRRRQNEEKGIESIEGGDGDVKDAKYNGEERVRTGNLIQLDTSGGGKYPSRDIMISKVKGHDLMDVDNHNVDSQLDCTVDYTEKNSGRVDKKDETLYGNSSGSRNEYVFIEDKGDENVMKLSRAQGVMLDMLEEIVNSDLREDICGDAGQIEDGLSLCIDTEQTASESAGLSLDDYGGLNNQNIDSNSAGGGEVIVPTDGGLKVEQEIIGEVIAKCEQKNEEFLTKNIERPCEGGEENERKMIRDAVEVTGVTQSDLNGEHSVGVRSGNDQLVGTIPYNSTSVVGVVPKITDVERVQEQSTVMSEGLLILGDERIGKIQENHVSKEESSLDIVKDGNQPSFQTPNNTTSMVGEARTEFVRNDNYQTVIAVEDSLVLSVREEGTMGDQSLRNDDNEIEMEDDESESGEESVENSSMVECNENQDSDVDLDPQDKMLKDIVRVLKLGEKNKLRKSRTYPEEDLERYSEVIDETFIGKNEAFFIRERMSLEIGNLLIHIKRYVKSRGKSAIPLKVCAEMLRKMAGRGKEKKIKFNREGKKLIPQCNSDTTQLIKTIDQAIEERGVKKKFSKEFFRFLNVNKIKEFLSDKENLVFLKLNGRLALTYDFWIQFAQYKRLGVQDIDFHERIIGVLES